jgi:hypothetical protein
MGSTGRASRVGYRAAGLVVLMGLVAAVGWGWAGLSGMLGQVEAFARTDVPGEGVLTVQEPVDLTVFYEAPGIDQEQAELPPLTLYVFDPDGAPVTVSGYGSELTYHVGEYTGRAVATFSAASPGDYRVLIEGDAPPEATLAVGESFGGSLGALIGAGVLLFVTLGVAVALVAITASRRRKSSASPGPALTHAPPPTVRVPSSH